MTNMTNGSGMASMTDMADRTGMSQITGTAILNTDDYTRIEQAIRFIENNFTAQLSLEEIAASANLSKFHFTRLFKRWAGVSPIQFQQFLTLEYTKGLLRQSQSILDVTHEAGLSGPARLHDLFVNFEAMSPGEFKKQGQGLTITYGFGPSPFGECLLAITERGICHLGFVQSGNHAEALATLTRRWPGATMQQNTARVSPLLQQVFSRPSHPLQEDRPFTLLLKGTNFQIHVWKALLAIPEGSVVSYQDIAAYIGRPKAVRAVATAIANNPVGYLIPCHRVISKTGNIHKYQWGSTKKKMLLGVELQHSLQPDT